MEFKNLTFQEALEALENGVCQKIRIEDWDENCYITLYQLNYCEVNLSYQQIKSKKWELVDINYNEEEIILWYNPRHQSISHASQEGSPDYVKLTGIKKTLPKLKTTKKIPINLAFDSTYGVNYITNHSGNLSKKFNIKNAYIEVEE